MRLWLLPLLAVALGACAEFEQAVDTTARQGAKGVVAETLATRFPQVPRELITPFTDCVIDNADAVEVREFARAAVVGVTDETAVIVKSILSRPGTVNCLSNAAVKRGIT